MDEEEDYYYDYLSEWVRGSEELPSTVQQLGTADVSCIMVLAMYYVCTLNYPRCLL